MPPVLLNTSQIIDQRQQADPWLVMLHGLSHTSDYFSEQVTHFQSHFRILLVDLRGHGRAAACAGPYGIEEYVDDVLLLLDAAGIGNAHFWGTHTGAAVSLVLALRQPERCSSLILEGAPLPGYSMPRLEVLVARARMLAQTEGLAVALEDWLQHADWFENIRAHPQECRALAHRNMVLGFAGLQWLSPMAPRALTPVSEHLARISMPTLIYNGAYDLDDFTRAAACLQAGLPNAQQHVIQDAGAFPAWERPHAVSGLVQNFLL